MVFETDKFISCIQNNPSIWEMGNKEYMDKYIKQKSWLNIGEIMYPDWTETPESEKENKVKEMKTKWRHIRDHYSKFLNQAKSGDSAKKRKYCYAESLSFLQHTIQKRRTTGNFTEEHEENEEGDSHLNVDSDGYEEDEVIMTTSNNHKQNSKTSTIKSKTKNQMTQFQRALLNSLSASASEEDNVNSDPDKAFLFSLLPDYKKLNSDQKMDFRLQTLQFFKNISTQTKETQPSQPTAFQCNQTPSNVHQSTPAPSSYPFKNQSFSYLPSYYSFPDNQPVVPPTSVSPYAPILNPPHSQINNPYTSSSYPMTSEQSERIQNNAQHK